MKLPIHPSSIQVIRQLAKQKAQGVVVTGDEGSGLAAAAEEFARSLDATIQPVYPIDKKTGQIDVENGTLLVESIRQLYELTRSKATKPTVVVIYTADRMTSAAQGAILKLLEEPREDLHFALLTHRVGDLASTILSRVSSIHLLPISKDQSLQLIKDQGVNDPTKQAQIMFIGAGQPELIIRLASDEDFFQKQSLATKDAKALLESDAYNKLMIVQRYKDNRQDALRLLDKCLVILRRSISAKPSVQLASKIEALLEAKLQVETGANIRITLAKHLM